MSDAAIIVGGGHAAAELAVSLREQGWSGPIAVYGEESTPPYQRPPLSKAFLTSATAEDRLAIRPGAAYEKAAVELNLGTRVVAIDVGAHRVELADGRRVDYRALALVTGARPRMLAVPGAEQAARSDNCHVLRSLPDARSLRAACRPGSRLVVIGAGYIGLEVAASALGLGVSVTLLEGQPKVLARTNGPQVAAFIEAEHRARGVDLRTGVGLAAIETAGPDGRVSAVLCQDGSRIACDALVVAVGVVPNVELASAAGIAIDNGIATDAEGRTSATDVVAAGDCASFPSALYGGRRIRLESVPNAIERARTLAATLNGKSRIDSQAPWFWSDQYDIRLKSVGLHQGSDRSVLRGDPASRSFSVFYLQGSRILAVDTVNRPPEFLLAKRVVAEGHAIPDAVLADDTQPLKEAVPPA